MKAIRAHSPIAVAMQVGHAGRKASSQEPWNGGGLMSAGDARAWQPLGPSALAHMPGETPCGAMTLADIRKVVDDFVAVAMRAERLGIDALELHGAHGYLIDQFLWAETNLRDDRYGGSIRRRATFGAEIVAAIRARTSEKKNRRF